ncbi:hypothetical protein AZI85_03405 [Bdellovibrio bacteriovorus]|uniref:Uncharacterized protein n=1 Tax=Bdellovibrio bacteriovorus TaxID=959 RepID=A0A150WKL6_BDEBC|nr:DUF4105 domain-containing protein [Bdellovibrio bacteriovorus]KYG64474.1 hypothetical protein AZI85_03405 [Bdellovibrio bacteriovorus]
MLLSVLPFLFLNSWSASSVPDSSSAAKVLQIAQTKKLAEDRQWQKLLHFERDTFFVTESQIDSPNFFLSVKGKKDPHAELEATIQAFFQEPPADVNEHAQCKFPARYQWLKDHLKNENILWKDLKCDRYLAFAKGMQGESVSLVFSSYYLNNPSSAFGHTFLRVNKAAEQDGQRHELLDYGLNYAAEADTNNAFLYGFKGLFGLFPGQFRAIPYYYKVREYNNAESRDLWEYELDIKPRAVSMLVAHVWELGPAQIDYWYLTENCSYHMLSILEAADPNVDILAHLDHYVIPADTIRVLWIKTSLIKSYKYRPSIRQVYFERGKILNKEEQKEFAELVHQIRAQDEIVYGKSFQDRTPESQAKILDAFIDFIDFQYSKEVQEAGREAQLKMRVLGKRSEIAVEPQIIKIDPAPEDRPHLAHPSGRWGVGYLHDTSDKDLALLTHRFALHDRLDPAWGYPTYSQITFFDLGFSYGSSYSNPDEKRFELENFAAFELVSASPWSKLIPDHSWRFKLGIERTRNENFLPTHEGVMKLGGGWTFDYGTFDITAQVQGEVHYGPSLADNNFWVGAGPLLEVHYKVNAWWLWQAGLYYRRDSAWNQQDYFRSQIETQYSFTKSFGVRASYRNERFLEETSLQLFNYY